MTTNKASGGDGIQVELFEIPKKTKCKKIEENNRMGKTRDLFKKIRDTKGIFHAKMDNKGQKWHGPNGSRRH